MNKKLFRQIRQHILEDARRFDMGSYAAKSRGKHAPSCGTVGCIAGWAVFLTDGLPRKVTEDYYLSVPGRAQKALGLTDFEAGTVFHVGFWPDKYRRAHGAACNQESRTEVAARYINHIIRTGKVTE